MPKTLDWNSSGACLPPSSTKAYSRIIEKWLKFEEKSKRLADIISDPLDIISPFLVCQHLSLFKIHTGGSTVTIPSPKTVLVFSLLPCVKFLSVGTGIPILHPAAWCNYVFSTLSKCQSRHSSWQIVRWRCRKCLNIENVISNDSFHCPSSFPCSVWCLCQLSGPMNNNELNKDFHQYTFPDVPHSLIFLPCLLEQSFTSSHLYLYELRHCLERLRGKQRHLWSPHHWGASSNWPAQTELPLLWKFCLSSTVQC